MIINEPATATLAGNEGILISIRQLDRKDYKDYYGPSYSLIGMFPRAHLRLDGQEFSNEGTNLDYDLV